MEGLYLDFLNYNFPAYGSQLYKDRFTFSFLGNLGKVSVSICFLRVIINSTLLSFQKYLNLDNIL